MADLQHDPVPDGRTGPFLRKRHRRLPESFGYGYDARCERCRRDYTCEGCGELQSITLHRTTLGHWYEVGRCEDVDCPAWDGSIRA